MKAYDSYTTIRIRRVDRDRMDRMKRPGDTYADLIQNLLNTDAFKKDDKY